MDRVARIRVEEKKYHDDCYEHTELFKPGSWLHKPVKTVMDVMKQFDDREHVDVLDLGCGIGRNAIPIAEALKHRCGKVVCVDILTSAIEKLRHYSREYEVQDRIEAVISDIEQFGIQRNGYDFIFAVSALEHVSSAERLEIKLQEMSAGTRPQGIICIIIGSNIREVELESGRELEPMFEVNFPTDKMLEMLDRQYGSWDVQQRFFKPLEYDIERNGQPVKLSSDCITYVIRKK